MPQQRIRSLFSSRALAWYFYDFANSLLIINGTLYFSQWVVVDNGVSDFWYSLTFILSTIALIFTAPYLGVLLDRVGARKKFLLWLTLATAVLGSSIELFGKFLPSTATRVLFALIAYALMNICYQLSLLVYNTYLKNIARERDFGTASGLGFGIGTLGSMVGLLVTYPIITGRVTIFGGGRLSVLIPGAILFLLCSLPMIRMAYKISRQRRTEAREGYLAAAPSYGQTYRKIWQDLNSARKYSGVGRFLLAFYFFSDAQLTIFLFSAIYLDKVLHAPDSFKIVAFWIVLGTSTIAAWIGGWLGDRFGHKPVFLVSLVINAFSIGAVALGNELSLYYLVFIFFGLSSGAAYATSRALLAQLIPYEAKGQFFGLYSLSERFASIIGPSVWGILVAIIPVSGGLNYRIAVIAMGIFVIVAAGILGKLKAPVLNPAPEMPY